MSAGLAGQFGRSLADGAIAHRLSLEADLTRGPLLPYPVELEPLFRLVDPLQTLAPVEERVMRAATLHEFSTVRLILPSVEAVDWARAESFVAGLAGCHAPVAFEAFVHGGRAEFYLSAPSGHAGFVTSTWRAAYPNSALVAAPNPWAAVRMPPAVLCDMFAPVPYARRVRTVTPWLALLGLCAGLGAPHVAFWQVLFQPTRHCWQQNIAALLAAERLLGHRSPLGQTSAAKSLQEPLFVAALRVGTTDPSLVIPLRAFVGIFTADGTPFGCRTMQEYERLGHDDVLSVLRDRRAYAPGQFLTSSELATFVHPPDRASTGGIRASFLDGLLVPDRLRHDGVPLGVNHNRGVLIPVFRPHAAQNKSTWSLGRSRSGKTNALVHAFWYFAQHGHGVGFLDPHRVTALSLPGFLAGTMPERVVLLDFDAALPVAYNPFAHADPEDYGRLATEFSESFTTLFDAEGYHRLSHFLRSALYALFVLGANLASIPTLFAKTSTGDDLRQRVIRNARNDAVRHFWQYEYAAHGATAYAPLLNRLSALFLDDRTLRVFAQHENRVDIARIMDERQILIIAPPASREAASIVGGIMVAQAKHAAFRRVGTVHANHDFHFFIDEFPWFITSAKTLQSIIDECQKGGLSISVANQETSQIPSELLKAVYSIPNISVFAVNLPDARSLVHLFNGQVLPEALVAQGTGEVYARIGQDVVNFTVPPPRADHDPAVAAAIVRHSFASYYVQPDTSARGEHRRAPRMIESV